MGYGSEDKNRFKKIEKIDKIKECIENGNTLNYVSTFVPIG